MMLAHDALRRTSQVHPTHAALIAGDRSIDFATWNQHSDALAAALQHAGVERGDRCLIILDNCPELAIAVYAVLKAGGAFSIVSPATRDGRLAAIITDCSARTIIASPDLTTLIASVLSRATTVKHLIWTRPPGPTAPPGLTLSDLTSTAKSPRDPGTTPDDIATIIYTSGTMGEPKGVMLTHNNLINTTGVITSYLHNSPDDVVCCFLPMAFSYGLFQLLAAAHVGYTLMLERSFAFPMDVLRRAAAARITGLPAVPTVFARILQMLPLNGIDLSSLRYVTNAAAAIPPAHIRRFREAFPHVAFYSMYGQTECTRACYLDPALVDAHPHSVGRPIANSEAFIVDAAGQVLDPGEPGELVIRGANVMKGYWNKPEATSLALRPWQGGTALFTGDSFRMDSGGLLTFIGRRDDIFKCKGEKVPPRAVEEVIYELHEVAEVAVFGIEDPIDGLAVKAVIVPRENSTLSESTVRRHCQLRLEPFMVPRWVEFRAELPRTESGKLKRSALAPPAARGA
jgi:long-chain acyl-CoA synthetase